MRGTVEKAAGPLLRGQERAHFALERVVVPARVSEKGVALLGRPVEHRLKQAVDLFPAFRSSPIAPLSARRSARGTARPWRCSSRASR